MINDTKQGENRVKDFRCGCGKSYLSYPALFNHIKIKHSGEPVANMVASKALQKRGRPSTKKTNIDFTANENHSLEDWNIKIKAALNEAVRMLTGVPEQSINQQRVRQIDAFVELLVLLNCQHLPEDRTNSTSFGVVLLQYLTDLAPCLLRVHFEGVFVLLSLFTQFIMDSQNSRHVLTQGAISLVSENVNEFLNENLSEMAAFYELQSLQVLQSPVAITVFHSLLLWMQAKNYTQYKVTMHV